MSARAASTSLNSSLRKTTTVHGLPPLPSIGGIELNHAHNRRWNLGTAGRRLVRWGSSSAPPLGSEICSEDVEIVGGVSIAHLDLCVSRGAGERWEGTAKCGRSHRQPFMPRTIIMSCGATDVTIAAPASPNNTVPICFGRLLRLHQNPSVLPQVVARTARVKE